MWQGSNDNGEAFNYEVTTLRRNSIGSTSVTLVTDVYSKQHLRRILVPTLILLTRHFCYLSPPWPPGLLPCSLAPIFFVFALSDYGDRWYRHLGGRLSRTAWLCVLCWSRTSMLQHRLLAVTSLNGLFFLLCWVSPHHRVRLGGWVEPLCRRWQGCRTIPPCRLCWVWYRIGPL